MALVEEDSAESETEEVDSHSMNENDLLPKKPYNPNEEDF
jgi:hypothetical protein